MDVAVTDSGEPGDFGMVCHRKKQRRKRQKLLLIDLFLDFAKNTTLHGLRYITEVGLTAAEKVFWVITFVISVILCFFLIERVWHKWWFSPVIVSFNERMVSVSEVPFPSVTICPQWKFVTNDQSPYNYSTLYKKYYSHNKSRKREQQERSEDEKEKIEDATLICDSRFQYCTNRDMSDASVVKNINEISPRLGMIFGQCWWRKSNVPCNHMFRKVYTSEGVCFNFNSVDNTRLFKPDSIQKEYQYLDPMPKEWIKKYGRKSVRGQMALPTTMYGNLSRDHSAPNLFVACVLYAGNRLGEILRYTLVCVEENGSKPDLSLILAESPEQNDESCNSLSNGFKIYLQHPRDMPQASLYYYAAIEGQVSSLAIKFSVFNTSRRLEGYTAEQRQCYFDGNRELQYFKIYTYSNCRLECLSLYTYKKCGCVWFHMPHSNSSEICTAKQKRCVISAQDELATNNMNLSLTTDMVDRCTCLPRCESVQYDAEILKTNFELKRSLKVLRKLNDLPEAKKYMYNYSKVEMYFKEPRFVSMRRSELFGLTDFLANCGGLLGLFLGFSFLSLVEVFYFCTLRLWCLLKKDIKHEKKQLRESMYQKTS